MKDYRAESNTWVYDAMLFCHNNMTVGFDENTQKFIVSPGNGSNRTISNLDFRDKDHKKVTCAICGALLFDFDNRIPFTPQDKSKEGK